MCDPILASYKEVTPGVHWSLFPSTERLSRLNDSKAKPHTATTCTLISLLQAFSKNEQVRNIYLKWPKEWKSKWILILLSLSVSVKKVVQL